MPHRLIACLLLALAPVCLAGGPALAAESDKQRIERLEAVVTDLSRRLAEREAADAQRAQAAQQAAQDAQRAAQDAQRSAQQAAAQQQAAAAAAAAPAAPAGMMRSADNDFEVYGFAQADVIQDFKRVDPSWDATLRPSKIPTTEGQFGSDGQTAFSVRQSRLGVKGSGMLAGKPYEVKFEFDLYGVGGDAGQTTFRLRHAYGKWGPLLAGQTNTLFMDGDLFPNVVDYWGPAGMVFVRNPQIRYTFVDNGTWLAAVAIEHPNDDIDAGAIRLIDPELGTNLRGDESMPDFTAQIRYTDDWGHIQLSGLARRVGFDTVNTEDNEPKGGEFGWGVMLGGVFKWDLATFRTGVVYGNGIASYMNDGGMDLAPRAALIPVPAIFPPPENPPLNLLLSARAVPLLGITAYVDLQWTDTLSSSIGYSFTQVDNTNFQEGNAFHRGEYASANLLWSPVPRILTGLEFLWGQRTDNNGNKGDDLRLQFTVKVSFSSNDIWAKKAN